MLRAPATCGLALALLGAPASAQSSHWSDLGFGTAGIAGVPQLSGTNLRYGRPLVLTLSSARPNAPAFFIVGFTPANTPFFFGTLVPSNDLSVFVPVDGAGSARLRLVIPDLCPAVPLDLFAQCLVADATNPTGVALSDAITATIRDNVPSDFNGDGYSDLAIGVPKEDVAGAADAGAVNVAYGGPAGLTNAGNQLLREGADVNGVLLGAPEPDDRFGSAIATGDFDGDGYDDLAIGAHREDTPGGAQTDSGKVQIVYGSAAGLQGGGAGRNDQVFRHGANGMQGPPQDFGYLGKSICAGDFDGDGYDDLAIGAPYYNVSLVNDGVVHVLFGSSTGLTAAGELVITEPSGGAADDRFGWELESGDWNGDGFFDLAVGRPYEDIGADQDAGAVTILYMNAAGIESTANVHMDAVLGGVSILGVSTQFDLFGFALASGDFDGDGADDLAIGAPYRDFGAPLISAAGTVSVLYGVYDAGLVGAGNQLWTQDTAGVLGTAALGDTFGYALAAGDFDYDGFCDLAIGVPGDDVGATNRAGATNVLYGGNAGIHAVLDRLITQNSNGLGSSATDDEFGWSLWAGRLDGDCQFDLVFGIPGDVVGGVKAGSIEVHYWWNSPTAAFDQGPLSGAPQTDDCFGAALACSPDQRPL